MVELHRRSACNTTYDRKETDVKLKNPTYRVHTKYFIYKSVLSDVHWYIERSIYFKCIKMSKT